MKPLILDFKVSRIASTRPSLKYSFSKSLTVVHIDGREVPFIEAATNDVQLLTKTKVRQESDDDCLMLELKTKTEVRHERDDLHDSVLELETKTFVRTERDD